MVVMVDFLAVLFLLEENLKLGWKWGENRNYKRKGCLFLQHGRVSGRERNFITKQAG